MGSELTLIQVPPERAVFISEWIHASTATADIDKVISDRTSEAQLIQDQPSFNRIFSASTMIAGISSLIAAAGIGMVFAETKGAGAGAETMATINTVLASGTNEIYPAKIGAASRLVDFILTARSVALLDEAEAAAADAATADAIILADQIPSPVLPHVMFLDDGVLALQWQRGAFGVALTLTGDRKVGIAFRRPGQFYAENGIEVGISDQLPTDFTIALTKVVG
jgi:hypothetical protein